MTQKIPQALRTSEIHNALSFNKLERIHQGKICDTYAIGDGLRLSVRSNRVSIFDFVLPCEIPSKGEVLTALTAHWLSQVLADIPNHLVDCGSAIREHIPLMLRSWRRLQQQALVIRDLEMLPIEAIVRGYLTGSAWTAYQQGKPYCGITFPPGLQNGHRLAEPVFTPTTKEDVGHDLEMDAHEVAQQNPWLKDQALNVYQQIATYSLERGILFVDTKFEFSRDGILADEVGTPDSSRFWDKEEWIQALLQGKIPDPYDKQLVRNWGLTIETPFGVTGISRLKPENPEHVAFVHSLTVPPDIIEQTTQRYLEIFQRLTGMPLKHYQRDVMNIAL